MSALKLWKDAVLTKSWLSNCFQDSPPWKGQLIKKKEPFLPVPVHWETSNLHCAPYPVAEHRGYTGSTTHQNFWLLLASSIDFRYVEVSVKCPQWTVLLKHSGVLVYFNTNITLYQPSKEFESSKLEAAPSSWTNKPQVIKNWKIARP